MPGITAVSVGEHPPQTQLLGGAAASPSLPEEDFGSLKGTKRSAQRVPADQFNGHSQQAWRAQLAPTFQLAILR